MPDKEKEGLGLPPVSGILIILVAVGAIWINKPLKSSRPIGNGTSEHTERIEDVNARLWQDPFDVIHKHNNSGIDDLHSHHVIKRIISNESNKRNGTLNGIHIMGVMISGGPYVENSEERRRRRYAVLSALNVSGYKPRDSQHIGYFLPAGHEFTKKYKEKGTIRVSDLPGKIPFELFEYQNQEKEKEEKPLIILLWLDEDIFSGNLISKIRILSDVLHLPDDNHNVEKFTLLGPASSTTFRSMMKELSKPGDPMKDLAPIEFKILSPTATAADRFIFKGINGFKKGEEKTLTNFILNKDLSWNIFRTIRSDDELAKSLKEELKLRGVKPEKDNIVLISEWDTDYGRWLPKSIVNAFSPEESENIQRYSYMQGLDGQTFDDDHTTSENRSNNENSEKEQTENRFYTKPAIGKSQIDYLSRLTNSIWRQHKNDIKAIGVLGSDVYDKLLILQALRKKFPSTIFFTTDLDARYVHPDEFKWARNLIVASNFGLQLHPKLQRDIPPFRGNYQTAIFFSTLLSLNKHVDKVFNQDQIYNLIKPRIFEIGRHNPCELTQNQTNENKDNPIIHILNKEFPGLISDNHNSIYPKSRNHYENVNNICYSFIILMIGPLLLFVIVPKDYKKPLKMVLKFALPAFILIFGIYGIFLSIITTIKEPLLFYEGISIWPAEAIRIVSCICSLALIYFSNNALKENSRDLCKDLFDDKEYLTKGSKTNNTLKEKPNNDNTEHDKKSFIQTIIYWVLYILIITISIYLFKNCTTIDKVTDKLTTFPIWILIIIITYFLIKKRLDALDILKFGMGRDWKVLKAGNANDAKNEIPIKGPEEDTDNDNVKNILTEYYSLNTLSKQYPRIITIIILSLAFIGLLISVFGRSRVPFRGSFSQWADTIIISVASVAFLFLLFDVVIKIRICLSFVHRIMKEEYNWSQKIISKYNSLDNKAISYWLKIILIAENTKAVNKLIIYPIWSILIILISYSSYFDNWTSSRSLYIIFGVGLSIPIIYAYQLRNAANNAKEKTLSTLKDTLIKVTGEIPQDRKRIANQLQFDRLKANKQTEIDQIELIISEVKGIRDGAFVPFLQQPFVQAIIYLIGLIGVVLSQYSAKIF